MTELSDNPISPISYLKVFFRRKELIVFPSFIGLVLGVCTGILLPKKYESATTIIVQEGKTDNPLFNNLAVSTTIQQRLNILRESILGWDNIVKVIKRLNMDKNVKTPADLEAVVFKFKKNIDIELKQQNVILLSYVDVDPVKTQLVVQTITDIFIESNLALQNKETADAIAFIEEQLKVYRGKIKSAEIANMEDQLKELLVDSTEMHPKVKELKELIANKEAELKKENLEYTKSERLGAQTTSPLVNEIQKALNTINPSSLNSGGNDKSNVESNIYKVMLIDKLDDAISKEDVMARDVQVNNNIYNMLLQRLETAKITQRLQASKEGTKYNILEPPRVPLEPFQPNKPLVALMGLFFGAFVGAALVFLSEFFDKSFIDVADAKEHLGIPLLGAISKITTEDTLRQEREKQIWAYSLSLILGVTVIIVTFGVAQYLGK